MYDEQIGRFTTQDRYSEKYSYMTPYQYAALNPVKYIDINGDSIWVSVNSVVNNPDGTIGIQTNRYYYGKDGSGAAGFIDPHTSTMYTGNNQFISQVSTALGQLASQKAGNTLVMDLATRTDNVEIVQSKGNSSGQDGSYIRWNPNDNGVLGNLRPSYVGLAHEMAHVQDTWNGTIDNSVWFTYTTPNGGTGTVPKAEIYSTHIENQIRAEHGLQLRSYYAFDPSGTPNGSPILFNGTRKSRYYDASGNHNASFSPLKLKKQTPFTY